MCDQQSICSSLEYSINVKLLTEHNLEFLSLNRGCTGSSEATLVKMPHCWKYHVTAHIMKCPSLYTDLEPIELHCPEVAEYATEHHKGNY